MTERLKAGVQYDDWRGSAAADDLNHGDIRDLLATRGLINDGEFLIAIDAWTGENHDGRPVEPPTVYCLLAEARGYEDVQAMLQATDKPRLRKVQIELSHEQFAGLFKRLNIVLCARGLELEGREYEEVEER